MAASLAPAGQDPLACLLQKLRQRDHVSPAEEAALRDSMSGIRASPADKVLIRAGQPLTESVLLVDGFVCRYNDLRDGQRQISELHISGDFVDLHGFLLKALEHNVASLTEVRIALFPHDRLRAITEEHPHLARLLWFSTLLDAAIHRERILSIGRRSALSRVAHILCELNMRLQVVGLSDGIRYLLPLTQGDIADMSGLTSVHVNRMLKELRDAGLLTFRGGEVVIHDWPQLQRIAEFSPTYLYLDPRPI